MKFTTKKLATWIAALAIVVLAPLAHANLVANGGFEAPCPGNDPFCFDPSGPVDFWDVINNTANPPPSVSRAASPFHGGATSIFFDYSGDGGSVTQTVAGLTNPSSYRLDFFVLFEEDTSLFDVLLDGTSILGALGSVLESDGWTHYSGQIGPGGDLEFSIGGARFCPQGKDCSFAVDDVSIVAVPEPGSLLLVGAALAAAGMVRRRKQT